MRADLAGRARDRAAQARERFRYLAAPASTRDVFRPRASKDRPRGAGAGLTILPPRILLFGRSAGEETAILGPRRRCGIVGGREHRAGAARPRHVWGWRTGVTSAPQLQTRASASLICLIYINLAVRKCGSRTNTTRRRSGARRAVSRARVIFLTGIILRPSPTSARSPTGA
jgi:hypothetical protein